jgi:D-alanyl-lipoteichoic acid acyltransferase DltB (MBOAT superfamily)
MLFNSLSFVLGFLPITVLGFYALLGLKRDALAKLWLVLCSAFFYAFWSVPYLALLVLSMLVNYQLGRVIGRTRARPVLIAGLVWNLGLLGYFKYAGFFVASVDALLELGLPQLRIALPLAISFFTFQKIAYLVDCYRGRIAPVPLLEFMLFVLFFPQLIAGPIVHSHEVLPQFAANDGRRVRAERFAPALATFAMGLGKKVLIADSLAPYANAVFRGAEVDAVGVLDAWKGALAYTLQLYFDFSGYSDMAIGLALLFGVRLSLNFNSPYKATDIADFWRRWHMTLSRFLRDYLYIPLGGNRHGPARQYAALMLTMLLGGLWHGAGWTFVVWGGLHGSYLVVQRVFAGAADRAGLASRRERRGYRLLAGLVTFVAVVIAWVPFRADTFTGAARVLRAMAGQGELTVPASIGAAHPVIARVLTFLGVELHGAGGVPFAKAWALIGVFLLVAWLAPSSRDLMARYVRVLNAPRPLRTPRFRLTAGWSLATGLLLAAGVLSLTSVTEFMYFRF